MENLCNNQDPPSDWNPQNTQNNQEQRFEDNHNEQKGNNDGIQESFINQKEDFPWDDDLILDSSFNIYEIDSWVLDFPIQDNDNTLIPFSHEDSMTMGDESTGETIKSHDNLCVETALPLDQTPVVCHESDGNIKNHVNLLPETVLPLHPTSLNDGIHNHDGGGAGALPLHPTSLNDGMHNHGGGGAAALPLYHRTSFNDRIHNYGGGGNGNDNDDDDPSLHTTKDFLKDGYKWKKYGRKERKRILRCYYKCTHSSTCLAKKIVEMNEDEEITLIRYRLPGHDHPMPHKEQCSPLLNKADNSSDPYDRSGTRGETVVLRRKSETDNVVDGFKWKKYGEKEVKGNRNPRTYYKCTEKYCCVRRLCVRSFEDPEYVIVTYEGKHQHGWPQVKKDRGPGVFIGGRKKRHR